MRCCNSGPTWLIAESASLAASLAAIFAEVGEEERWLAGGAGREEEEEREQGRELGRAAFSFSPACSGAGAAR